MTKPQPSGQRTERFAPSQELFPVAISFAVKLPAPAYCTKAGRGHALSSSEMIFSFAASALSLGKML